VSREKLTWGLLSTARINRGLIPAIRAAERGDLLAVASRNMARAEAYAAEWEIPRAYGSYEAMLAADDIDAVYISLPNGLHAEWTIRAAAAGKHVLCEKPLAVKVEEVDQIIAAAEQYGVIIAEAVMYLYHPLSQKIFELVRKGAVGRVQVVRGSFYIDVADPNNVRWRPELGGGSVWDVGSYPLSFIRWVAGEPEEVFGWQTLSESGVDENFTGLLRCPHGVLGSFESGFRHQFWVDAEIVGTEGILRVDRPFIAVTDGFIRLRRGDDEEIIKVPEIDPYLCEVEAVTAAVLDGKSLPVPLSSSRANVATIVALYESARSGSPRSL